MKRILLCAALLLVLRADASPSAGRALVAVDHPAPGTAARLLDDGVVVLRDLGGYLVALADARDLALLESLSLDYRILDPAPDGKTFYIASKRTMTPHDSGVPAAPELDRVAHVCMESVWGDVVQATPEEADRLAAGGVEIARLFMTPMRAGVVDKPAPRTAPAVPDPVIEAMVDSVDLVPIYAIVLRLQDFVNRYALGDSVDSARDWIVARYHSLGIDSVRVETFDPLYGDNVIAVLPGIGHPEKLVIIGGHYDSTAQGGLVAPGADDNGTGTACVLECARILSQYQFDYTIVFINFCAEEQGLVGSEDYAAAAQARGDDIVAMVNVDMIGWLYTGDPLDLDIVDNESSAWIRDLLMAIAPMYVPELPAVDGSLPGGSNSDHASFWRHGYDAIMFWEDTNHWSPYIHTANDLVGLSFNSPELAQGSIRMAVSLVATLAEPFHVIIQHTPDVAAENPQGMYRVDATVLSNGPLNADSLFVRYTVHLDDAVGSVAASAAQETEQAAPLVWLGHGDEYEALIPPQPAGTVVDYYIVAEDAAGFRAVDPKDAPAQTHRFIVGMPTLIADDDFETDTGWTAGVPGDDAVSGMWVREAPHETYVGVLVVQPGYDHTADPDSICFVTGNAPAENTTPDYRDVDYGKTTLLSPVYDLSSYTNAWVRYHRWYSMDTGGLPPDDVWLVDVTNDGGATWHNIETLASSDRTWRLIERNVEDFVPLTATVQFRFVASDYGNSSVVEALVDDFSITSYTGTTATRTTPPRAVLAQNYPNPFTPHTMIQLAVPPPGERATLRVYDVAGRLVATLLDDELVSGDRLVPWDGRNRAGRAVSSGVYFYRLSTPTTTLTRKLVVVR